MKVKKILSDLIQTELDLLVVSFSIAAVISCVVVYGIAWIFGGL